MQYLTAAINGWLVNRKNSQEKLNSINTG